VTGDIDMRVRVALDDYTPAATNRTLFSKWLEAGDQRSFRLVLLTTGVFRLGWSTDGAAGTVVTVDSTTAVSTLDTEITWLRATLDVSNGNVNFYTSDDGDNWTLLGTADQGGAGATSIDDSTALLEIGSDNVGTGGNIAGKWYRAELYDGIAGTLEFDADPQDLTTHANTRITLTEKANSAVVTVFSTSATATRVVDNLYFPLPVSIATPKEITGLISFIDKGTSQLTHNMRVFHVGGTQPTDDPRMWGSISGTAEFGFDHDNGTATVSADQVATASIDDGLELRFVLGSDGSVLLGQSIDGAAETNIDDATANALAGAWNDTRFYLNSVDGASSGFAAFREAIWARRTRTLEHLRKVG
jgi:hypothetical protein